MARLLLFLSFACIIGCYQPPDDREATSGTHRVTAQASRDLAAVPAIVNPKLWPISVEGKWGFIDASGTVKIAPQFAKASPFREGLALVSKFGTSEADQVFDRTYDGFIDESGEYVIPAEFPEFYTKRQDYDSYGYSDFDDGVAVVRDASSSFGKKGLIDRNGKLIAPMIYDSLGWSFSEGLCSFKIDREDGRSERGYMDYRGTVLIRPRDFLYGSGFSEGRAFITVRDEQGDHKLLIDRDGHIIVGRGEYTAMSPFRGGLSRAVKDGEVGLVDRDGQVVVPLGEYNQISEPNPGSIFIGEKSDGFYAIDSNVQPKKLPDFGAEPMRYRGDMIWIKTEDDKDGYAASDGTILIKPEFDGISTFEGELARFVNGSEKGYVNRSGKIVWSTKQWERPLQPLQYSIREPLQSYLPDFGLEAMPLSYNWDCENAIVFVCDGDVEALRKFYLDRRSAEVEVRDHTDYDTAPGKLDIMIAFEGVAYVEVYAMHGDRESKDAEGTESFVRFYSCENMDALRKKYPDKTIGIILEN